MAPSNPLRVLALALALLSMALGCAARPADERAPEEVATAREALSSFDCTTHEDTGYDQGNPFQVTLVTVDGKSVEIATANAYYVMAVAAEAAGVELQIVSGFRTMAEQQYLYGCYINCNCNNCNLAAQPGYSNHQSGHALDLNTSAPGVSAWLSANAGAYGFSRTVPSEEWHWEWWGGGPGGGICGACSADQDAACGNYGCACVAGQCNGGYCPGTGCSDAEVQACGGFGCNCVDHQCSGGFCPGTGCTAKETTDCGNYGCGCVDHACNGVFCPGSGCTAKETNDCAMYGCGCANHACDGGACSGASSSAATGGATSTTSASTGASTTGATMTGGGGEEGATTASGAGGARPPHGGQGGAGGGGGATSSGDDGSAGGCAASPGTGRGGAWMIGLLLLAVGARRSRKKRSPGHGEQMRLAQLPLRQSPLT